MARKENLHKKKKRRKNNQTAVRQVQNRNAIGTKKKKNRTENQLKNK